MVLSSAHDTGTPKARRASNRGLPVEGTFPLVGGYFRAFRAFGFSGSAGLATSEACRKRLASRQCLDMSTPRVSLTLLHPPSQPRGFPGPARRTQAVCLHPERPATARGPRVVLTPPCTALRCICLPLQANKGSTKTRAAVAALLLTAVLLAVSLRSGGVADASRVVNIEAAGRAGSEVASARKLSQARVVVLSSLLLAGRKLRRRRCSV